MDSISIRERIFAIVKKSEGRDYVSRFYNILISITALASLIPLMTRRQMPFLVTLDTATLYILFLDYILRWMTYDYARPRYGRWAFALYPLTPFALIDVLSFLPSLGLIGQTFRILRILRCAKVLHYSKNYMYISNVVKNERKTLLSVLLIALAYIFISALAMFCNDGETETFKTFFDALYWATTALTTVGYGDIYPHTDIGRLISMISSLFGIAIIALPAGIVTGGYIEQMHKAKEEALEPRAELPIRRLAKGTARRFILIIGIGIALNELCFQLARSTPLWLDMVGTCFAALFSGPAAGLIVGLVDNDLLALSGYGNASILYFAASAAAALILGCAPNRAGTLRLTWKRALAAALGALTAVSLIVTIVARITNGGLPSGQAELTLCRAAMDQGAPVWLGCLYGTFVIKALDALVTAAILIPVWKIGAALRGARHESVH